MTSARIESRMIAAARKLAAAIGGANPVVVFGHAEMTDAELSALVEAKKRKHPAGTPLIVVRFVRARAGRPEI